MKNLKKKKGFTLIELIVVIAILGILAAIAIPNFSGLSNSSKVKADGSTAAEIVNAARIQEADTGTTVADIGSLLPAYITPPAASQSGLKGAFVLSGGGTSPYVVKWYTTGTTKGYKYTENTTFNPTIVDLP